MILVHEILNDIQCTAKRCIDTAKTVHDSLEAADLGFMWGIMQAATPHGSMRGVPRGSPTSLVQTPVPQSQKIQVPMTTTTNIAARASAAGSSPQEKQNDMQAASTQLQPQPSFAEIFKHARATSRINRPAIEAVRRVLKNAEHPVIQAAYEANRVVEYVEISVLPHVGVLVEEFHDKAAESHQKTIAKLVSVRGETNRTFQETVLDLLTDKSLSIEGISKEDRMALLDIVLGRGRDVLIGLFLTCTVLPELGAELSKIANRIQAKIAVQAAKGAITPPQAHSMQRTDTDAPKEQFSIKTNAAQPVDFIILTAIDVELRAVRKVFGLNNSDRVKVGTRVYWRGSVRLNDKESYTIVVAQATDVANPDAALLTADMIREWSPGAALFVGIAATSDPHTVSLGDIVVGTEVYYYERRKETRKGARPEPKSIPADSTLLNNIRSIDWANEVPISRPDASDKKPRVHFGVIGCGEKVIADAKKRDGLAKANRKILAIEMEGYGFSLAACQSFEKVRHLDIRGVCDDASDSKDDQWHEYAAAAAAAVARDFLLDRPLEPRAASTEPVAGQAI